MNNLKVDSKVRVINEDRVEYNEVGTVVRVASNRIDEFYVVDFVGKNHVYFEKEELEVVEEELVVEEVVEEEVELELVVEEEEEEE